ncbi:hypothetical protein HPP92_027918 [Vanilla planifolia]|uniref:G-patch domain-containing protein n=1 Tax=Vanilla planifolia TaxID=51239 RepID=A0A835U499_VANPL|nr:hypothetical protein HPP92_027918 [Vanilla planifolia]
MPWEDIIKIVNESISFILYQTGRVDGSSFFTVCSVAPVLWINLKWMTKDLILEESHSFKMVNKQNGNRPVENLDTDNLEQASLDTQLTSSNIGYRLLQKMGWKGKGLGKDEQGIVEPIKAGIRDPKLGVGKQEEDDFFTAGENVQRRKLDVELEETVELAKKREVIAEREQKIQTEVKEIKKVFFCSLCNKQYKLAVEFEAHLSSYDHNHRKRFKEMREMHAVYFATLGTNSNLLWPCGADAQKRQHEQLEDQLEGPTDSSMVKSSNAPPVNDQRQALKFGFTSRLGSSKKPNVNAAKKPKTIGKVASVFGDDSEDES